MKLACLFLRPQTPAWESFEKSLDRCTMAKKGSNFSSWKSVFSVAQFKKDMIESHTKDKLSFWGTLLYVGLPVLGVCGLNIYRIFQSIFEGNEFLASKQIIFLVVCFVSWLLFIRGGLLWSHSREKEKRSSRSLYTACGGFLILFVIGTFLGVQQ